MTVIESGNNATHGYFLDKPDIEARHPAGGRRFPRLGLRQLPTFNGFDKDGSSRARSASPVRSTAGSF
jgi:hypothetical protein